MPQGIRMAVRGMFTMHGKTQEEERTATADGFVGGAQETAVGGLQTWIEELRHHGYDFADGHGVLTGAIIEQGAH